MALAQFIQDLIEEGKVKAPAPGARIAAGDLDLTKEILHGFYRLDSKELAGAAPAFDGAAAVWAASYFYNVTQLLVDREAEIAQTGDQLEGYSQPVTATNSYSVDLVFRHLPMLAQLARGLAPADGLVDNIHTQLGCWPLSSVGTTVTAAADHVLFTDESIRQLYIDRIIINRDKQRAAAPLTRNYIMATVGDQLPILWPGYENEQPQL